jgi:ankyrin repeat protein
LQLKVPNFKWVKLILFVSVCGFAPQTYAAPQPAPSASKVAALVDDAFGAMWMDSDLEEADIEDTVRAALRAGASPDSRDEYGETLLLQAIENNRESIVRLLLRSGADVNLADTKLGDTPLIRASYTSDTWAQSGVRPLTALVRLLLQRRADPNRRNKAGETALTLAACLGFNDIVAALLRSKADFRLPNKQGFTPLQMASLSVPRGSVSFVFPPTDVTKEKSERERMMERTERDEEKRLAVGRAKARLLLQAAGAKK